VSKYYYKNHKRRAIRRTKWGLLWVAGVATSIGVGVGQAISELSLNGQARAIRVMRDNKLSPAECIQLCNPRYLLKVLMFTSYFGNVKNLKGQKLVAISQGIPKWYIGPRYMPLAPSWGLIKLTDEA